MSVTIGNAFIISSQTWTTFKSTIAAKIMPLQWDLDPTNEFYQIYAVDSPIVYTTFIYLGAVPDGVAVTYSQAQNDLDRADFENNYKSNGNKPLDVLVPVTGSNTSGGLANFYGAYISTAATSLTAVRASTFVEQTFPARRSFSSTNDNDNVSGSGTRQIRLTYYDGAMNGPYTEDLYLTGTTAVNTVNTNIQFVESFRSTLVGGNGGNVGNINMFATSSGGGGLIAQIPSGDGKTYYGHHYVRPGSVFSVEQLFVNSTAVAAGISIRAINPFVTGSFEDQIGTTFRVLPGGAGSQFDLQGDMRITGPARMTVYAKPDSPLQSTFFVNLAWEEF